MNLPFQALSARFYLLMFPLGGEAVPGRLCGPQGCFLILPPLFFLSKLESR